MTSPLEQAQQIEKGCYEKGCYKQFKNSKWLYCEECKAKAQTLLETCEYVILQILGHDMTSIKQCKLCDLKEDCHKAISICKEILK